MYWSVGVGCFVNFWNDPWLKQVGPLKAFAVGSFSIDETIRVCDAVGVSGGWDVNRISAMVPMSIVDLIAAVFPPCLNAGPDRLAWKRSKNG